VPRDRLGVAILLPEQLAAEVRGLRRAIGSPSLLTQPPHITLVPPINVHHDEVDRAITVVREAASNVRGPLHFSLNGCETFAPVSPVVFLRVDGDIRELTNLRERCLRPPLQRRIDHEYVPHVTLHENVDGQVNESALRSMDSFSANFAVTHIDVLRQDDDRVWRSIADVAIGGGVVRGRGTLDLVLSVGQQGAPDAVRLVQRSVKSLVMEARTADSELLGALTYSQRSRSAMQIDHVVVVERQRGIGIGSRLFDEAVSVASTEGLAVVVDIPPDLAYVDSVLRRRGFEHLGDGRWRKH
jgi:2'-5' RNA ligase/predicted GNAT family acetyltransferase